MTMPSLSAWLHARVVWMGHNRRIFRLTPFDTVTAAADDLLNMSFPGVQPDGIHASSRRRGCPSPVGRATQIALSVPSKLTSYFAAGRSSSQRSSSEEYRPGRSNGPGRGWVIPAADPERPLRPRPVCGPNPARRRTLGFRTPLPGGEHLRGRLSRPGARAHRYDRRMTQRRRICHLHRDPHNAGFTGEIRRDPSKPEGSRGERSTSGGRGGFLGQWHASRSETD